MIQYIIIILLSLLFLLLIVYRFYHREHYGNSPCPKDSYCAYNVQNEQCECVSQKDDARLQFPNSRDCCPQKCHLRSKAECMSSNSNPNPNPNPNSNPKFYCNLGGVCKEFSAASHDGQIMANICGIDQITNQYIMPYASKEECAASADPCGKYNDQKSERISDRNGCLSNTNCGICYNENSDGKCVSGTPLGPNDPSTYYFCKPGDRKSNGSLKGVYMYGKEFT